jgi:hypothetical protein
LTRILGVDAIVATNIRQSHKVAIRRELEKKMAAKTMRINLLNIKLADQKDKMKCILRQLAHL